MKKRHSVKKIWLILFPTMFIILLMGVFIGSKLISRTSVPDESMLRKVESIESDGVYSPSDIGLILDKVLGPNEDLKSDVYYAEEFLADIAPGSYMANVDNAGTYFGFLKNLIGHYPTRNIRAVPGEDGHYYLVYLLSNGGRVFLFDDRGFGYGYAVYTETSRSYADFTAVAPGDDISKVSIIDSATEQYRKHFAGFMDGMTEDRLAMNREFAKSEGRGLFVSTHLLTDGLLLVFYEPVAKGTGYTFTVRETAFFDDYVLPDYYYIWNEEFIRENYPDYIPRNYPMRILKKDLPGEIIPVADDSMPASSEPAEAVGVDWSIKVSVLEKGATRSRDLTRREMEQAFSLSRIITSRFEENNPKHQVNTIIAEGVSISEILEYLDASKATRIVLVGTDGTEREITREQWEGADGHLIWIENNEYAIRWSENPVAVAFTDADPYSYFPSLSMLRILFD